MNRAEMFKYLTEDLYKVYEAKNADYGSSVTDTYNRFGDISFLVRITDKYNRICTLMEKEAKVKDETIDDTIQDLINYLILWQIERKFNGK